MCPHIYLINHWVSFCLTCAGAENVDGKASVQQSFLPHEGRKSEVGGSQGHKTWGHDPTYPFPTSRSSLLSQPSGTQISVQSHPKASSVNAASSALGEHTISIT